MAGAKRRLVPLFFEKYSFQLHRNTSSLCERRLVLSRYRPRNFQLASECFNQHSLDSWIRVGKIWGLVIRSPIEHPHRRFRYRHLGTLSGPPPWRPYQTTFLGSGLRYHPIELHQRLMELNCNHIGKHEGLKFRSRSLLSPWVIGQAFTSHQSCYPFPTFCPWRLWFTRQHRRLPHSNGPTFGDQRLLTQ